MMTVTHGEQKKAKLRFLLLYGISLVLIFIVVTAFWKKGAGTVQQTTIQSTEQDGYFMQHDTILHARMNNLDRVYSAYLKSNRAEGSKEATELLSAKYNFRASLDSLEKQADSLGQGTKKQMLDLAVAEFRRSFDAREKLVSDLVALPKDSRDIDLSTLSNEDNSSAENSEIEQLKYLLTDKEQQIALLEKQALELRQNNASVQNPSVAASSNDTEWRQKYSALKVAFDKKVANEKSLQNAYKTVADDNRRLLQQLQEMKKN